MVALNAKTGSLLWTASTFGAVDTSPTVSNGIVYVGSDSGSANNGIVYAFNATTGALVWSATTGGAGDILASRRERNFIRGFQRWQSLRLQCEDRRTPL